MKNARLNKTMIATILALAWPTMLEQLMQTAVQYIDTAMVGSLGTHATAAVGATTTVNWLVGSTISALGVGFLSFIARAYGAGDKKAASRAVSQAMIVAFFAGTLFTALTLGLSGMVPVWMQVDPAIQDLASRYFFILYLPMLPRTATIIFGTALRAAGDTKTPMKVGVWVNVINVVLNFLLIYPTRSLTVLGLTFTMPGAGMGVLGAAAASAIAFAYGGIRITYVLWKHPLISPRGASFKPDMAILKPCMKIALPNICLLYTSAAFNQAFTIWLLRGTFMSISEEMEQAAKIDGCNRMQSMFKILLPMAAPGIVTTLIFIFINAWNEYTVALCLISTDTLKPLTVGINIFNGYNIIEWQYLFAASIFAIIPVVIMFMSIEKNLTSGLTAGGVKG